ncbi:HLH-domain-containing protein [Thelephora terrestris]|uniref:HLH-domain-containing protein n=1 Tax=Thelephora terrestris TaxID=56493 RepID=A0A9P6L9K6_9AGAM|nr:HLH-domain-containing protein [Thelephora terrestris]
MTSLYPPSSYRQPVVRQEGFHLPSASSTNGNNPPSPSQPTFDSNGQLYIPQLLSDPFRKFSGDSATPSMDFSEELASLIVQSPTPHTSHQSSHERSTHSPPTNGSGSGFDDSSYRPQATHNIYDISVSANNNQQHPPPHGHNNFTGQFALNPAQSQPQAQQYHNLHEFSAHSHFNSTLPALNSTMRYDPQPPQTHPPAHEHPNPPSFTNHFSPTSSEFSIRHSPSPVGFTSAAGASRSRSRSRAPTTSAVNSEPPSTNGGPTRTIRHKRNSISSVSPPPHHRAQAIVIPSSHPHRAASQHTPTSATSPLSLHTLNENSSSWFVPSQQQQAHDFRHNEFNLQASEGVGNHHSFAQFNPGSVGSAVSLGVSPKDVAVVKAANGAESEDDTASKQAMLAVEKRRRRRESHNAVERRRRDNINERIAELATLIPESILDPNAPITPRSGDEFLFGITGISGLSNPLGSEGLASTKTEEDEDSGECAAVKKAGGTNGTHTEGGVVKANKGMILRKSVEYIKYLQQLVSAQASRNRDLEQEIHVYQQNGTAKLPNGPDMGGKNQDHFEVIDHDADGFNDLVLHEEADPDFARHLNNYTKNSYNVGLGPMPEEDTPMDTRGGMPSADTSYGYEDGNASRMDSSLTPPSVGTGSIEGDDDRVDSSVELNRGRDRTIRQNGMSDVQVKSEIDDMQT